MTDRHTSSACVIPVSEGLAGLRPASNCRSLAGARDDKGVGRGFEHHKWRWVLALVLFIAMGCGADPAARARVAERDQLRREVAGYRKLLAIARTGLLASDSEVIVSLSDTLLRGLLDAALPVSVAIPGNVTVTLTKARVTFRANVARVDLTGDVRRDAFPSITALVSMRGALDAFFVDSAQVLRARLTIDDVALDTPSGVPSAFSLIALDLLQGVVERGLPEMASSFPVVAIPVRLDREIRLPGFGPSGALSILPVRAPMSITASRVVAFQNRLWIILNVARGDFVPLAGPRS
jgi:hypothetical protein